MTAKQTFVVVGAGLAAGKAVRELRDSGFDGHVVLYGAEAHPPYERPPLSKGYLMGNDDFESTLVQPLQWYREDDIDLRLGTRVTASIRPPGPSPPEASSRGTTSCCSPPARDRVTCRWPTTAGRLSPTCVPSRTPTASGRYFVSAVGW